MAVQASCQCKGGTPKPRTGEQPGPWDGDRARAFGFELRALSPGNPCLQSTGTHRRRCRASSGLAVLMLCVCVLLRESLASPVLLGRQSPALPLMLFLASLQLPALPTTFLFSVLRASALPLRAPPLPSGQVPLLLRVQPDGSPWLCSLVRGGGGRLGVRPRLLLMRTRQAGLFPSHTDSYFPASSTVIFFSHWELCLWLWEMWAGGAGMVIALWL